MKQINQDLIADNMNLIYKFCSNKNIYDEDVQQGMFLKLCEVIETYDKNKSTFSTFVYMICENYLSYMYKKENTQKRSRPSLMIYLNAPDILDIEDNTDIKFDDKVNSDLDMDEFINSLKESKRELIKLKIMGYNNKEIAEMQQCTSQNISLKLKRIKRERDIYENNKRNKNRI